ncbi:YodC family protein [Salinarimonas chemoclinalis]|uniref:YodC family protein n=1 Tax=Salinarimonas chemoclinalis TaxID=3241599 RepID=UPI003557365D
MTFAVGDRVQLKSGGPGMTVESVGAKIVCVWFEGMKRNHAEFVPETLTPYQRRAIGAVAGRRRSA